jgi:hypothetical protein
MIAGSAMAMAAALWASAAGAIGGAAQPRQMGGVGITVYADAGFKGDNATFRSDQSDIGPSGFGNRISSLQVAAGEIWEVCANTEYRPPCQVFSGTETDLRRRNWNDRILSLRRVRNPGGGSALPRPPLPGASLTLYSDDRFRGSTRVITGPTASLGSFNDDAQSLRITGGVWDVCEDIDFGKCRTVDRDMSSLGALGLDKRISSVRPAFGRGGDGSLSPQPERRLVIYDGENYRGRARTYDSAVGRLGSVGSAARSVQVIGTWQLCDGPEFTGRCITISQNAPNLADMSNRIGSARPVGRR